MNNAVLLDDSPDIENSTPTIEYTMSNLESLRKHVDRNGYGTNVPFVDELGVVAELESLVKHGNEHKHMLYTFRSCARAVPQVTKLNEAHKDEIYQATWQVLRPVMEKIKHVMDFQQVVVQKFASEVHKLSTKMNDYNGGSDMLLDQMVQILDLICVLDHLKDNKTSIKDDFNCYKRTFHHMQSILTNTSMVQEEMESIQLFLSDPRHPRRYIFHKLKQNLTINCEPVLVLLIRYCMTTIETRIGILPTDRCRPHRVLPFLMNLLDGLGASTSRLNSGGGSGSSSSSSSSSSKDDIDINVFVHKQIDIKKLSKMLRRRPIVPLFMDMHVTVFILLQDCPHFDRDDKSMRKQWSGEDSDGTEVLFYRNYSLENEERWATYRRDHSQYMVELQRMLNDVTNAPKRTGSKDSADSNHLNHLKGVPDLPPGEYEKCSNMLVRGFRLLSELTTSVQYQCAWKSGHSATRSETIDKSTGDIVTDVRGVDYALATVHNYTRSEMKVLVDVLSMIKSLASLLRRAEGSFASIVRFHCHRSTQVFAQHVVLGLLYKAQKHKRPLELTHLMQLRSLAADWSGDVEPFEDYKSKSKIRHIREAYDNVDALFPPPFTGSLLSTTNRTTLNNEEGQSKKDSRLHTERRVQAEQTAERTAPLPARAVAPSPSQLQLMRCMVRALYDERAPWLKKGGLFSSGTFTKKDLKTMADFYTITQYFPLLLNYGRTTTSCSDVSSLWYREFYLELTRQVQFPISMSLPWKLAEHVIKSPQNNMLNNVLYAMDIYNDVAQVALNVLRQQHVYDEIEAEVNLVFDQLIFLLNEEVYNYCNNVAAMLHLDDSFRATLRHISVQKKEKKEKKDGGAATGLLAQFDDVAHQRYRSVVTQRHVNLLGRSIDLRALMIERLNNSLRRDIESCVAKFESGDLTGVCELDQGLIILRETRLCLGRMVESETALEDFDLVLGEINESNGGVGPGVSRHGRVAKHILFELVNDVYPNWLYNEVTRRFIKPSSQSIRRNKHEQYKNERNKKPTTTNGGAFGQKYYKAYDSAFRLLKGYIGREHCEGIVSVLEYTGDLYTVLDELIQYQKILVLDEISPYVAQLQIGTGCSFGLFLLEVLLGSFPFILRVG